MLDAQLLCRLGGPRYLGGIVLMWGVVAMLFAGMRNTFQFYALRFILGLAESGAYPGKPHSSPASGPLSTLTSAL